MHHRDSIRTATGISIGQRPVSTFKDKCIVLFSSLADSLVFRLLDKSSIWSGIFCLHRLFHRPLFLAMYNVPSSLMRFHFRILNTTLI
jgi:hypothetical protein